MTGAATALLGAMIACSSNPGGGEAGGGAPGGGTQGSPVAQASSAGEIEWAKQQAPGAERIDLLKRMGWTVSDWSTAHVEQKNEAWAVVLDASRNNPEQRVIDLIFTKDDQGQFVFSTRGADSASSELLDGDLKAHAAELEQLSPVGSLTAPEPGRQQKGKEFNCSGDYNAYFCGGGPMYPGHAWWCDNGNGIDWSTWNYYGCGVGCGLYGSGYCRAWTGPAPYYSGGWWNSCSWC